MVKTQGLAKGKLLPTSSHLCSTGEQGQLWKRSHSGNQKTLERKKRSDKFTSLDNKHQNTHAHAYLSHPGIARGTQPPGIDLYPLFRIFSISMQHYTPVYKMGTTMLPAQLNDLRRSKGIIITLVKMKHLVSTAGCMY